MTRERECHLLSRFSRPIGLNLVEEWMIYNIYCREMALRHKRFLAVVLCGASLGCTTAHSAPPAPIPAPPPYVCSTRPIRGMTIQGTASDGTPIEGPSMVLDTPICVCSDGIVRLCGQ